MKKAVFFDIDGTLWYGAQIIPESTKEAVRRLQENGIYTFLCTGRTCVFLNYPELTELNFDGIVAGCGTYVAVGDEVVVYQTIEPQIIADTLKILEKYQMPAVLEGRYKDYMDEGEFKDRGYVNFLKHELGDNLLTITGNEMKWEASKFCANFSDLDCSGIVKELESWYNISSFGSGIECVAKGCTKATGIDVICKKLGIKKEDTYGFGDSANDLEMFSYVGCGIAMGNGSDVAKQAADYVTDTIDQDGIFNACKHFGLI